MSSPYQQALALIDSAHAEDPNKAVVNGEDVPYELHYARKMSMYLDKLYPSPTETLRLAVRAQHFRRWEVPRSQYPMNRQGYFAWRTFLKKRQAELASNICKDSGYSEKDATRVAALIKKEDMKNDHEAQTLEDVACLVFLDDQFEEFEKEHDEKKILNILKKTWFKMSDKGHELALQITMSGRAKELITKAISS
jgi:hypothetical protein